MDEHERNLREILDAANKGELTKSIRYALDASVCNTKNWSVIWEDVMNNPNKRFVLTTITIKELRNLKRTYDFQGMSASEILYSAVRYAEKFECVYARENLYSLDDCIIQWCVENKGDLILLTADQEMALKARAFGIETIYLEKLDESKECFTEEVTLSASRMINGKLFVEAMETREKFIRVISSGMVYRWTIQEVEIGDDVLVLKKNYRDYTLLHFSISKIAESRNCKLVSKIKIPKEASGNSKIFTNDMYRYIWKDYLKFTGRR